MKKGVYSKFSRAKGGSILYFYNEYWRVAPKISHFYGMEGAFSILFRQNGGSFLDFSLIIEKGGLSYISSENGGSFLYLLS